MNGHVGRQPGKLGRLWVSGALVMAFIATGALFLIRATGPGSMDLGPEGPPQEPDVRMEGAELKQFDRAGRLQYAMVSSDIQFFQADGRAELTAPNVTVHDADGTAWQVRAATGTLFGLDTGGAGEDEVRLRGDVLLQPLQGLEQVRLSTSAMTLYPDRQYATTDQAVIIDSEVGRTTAARLEGDLQGGLLKLFKSAERPVQTILLPGQFK